MIKILLKKDYNKILRERDEAIEKYEKLNKRFRPFMEHCMKLNKLYSLEIRKGFRKNMIIRKLRQNKNWKERLLGKK